MSPLMRFQMLSLASNNQLEDTQHDGGDTALIMSNNKKRKLSRASEHKTSEPTETCSYCQKHGGNPVGNPVGYAWQECRKLKVSRNERRIKLRIISHLLQISKTLKNPPPRNRALLTKRLLLGLLERSFLQIYPRKW